MTDFTIIEARPWHCGQMVRLLRVEHQQAVAHVGVNSHLELRARFDASSFRRAWIIDGRLGAVGGVTGSRLAPEGYVWLAFSNAATRFPLEIIKESRRQLAEIAITKRRLLTTILDHDQASKRFAIFLGFVPIEEERRAPAESRFGRRDMLRHFENNTEAQTRLGVAMVYEPKQEAA